MHFSREWLNKELATIPTEEKRTELKMMFLNNAADLLVEECEELSKELSEKAERENDLGLKAYLIVHKAFSGVSKGIAPEKFISDMRLAEQMVAGLNNNTGAAVVLQMCAFNYWASGDRDRAFELSYASRKVHPLYKNEGYGWSDFQLAVFHSDLKDYQNATKYFQSAELLAQDNKYTYQLARIYSGQAAVAIAENRMDDAMQLNEKALNAYRESGHHTAVSRALNDLGVIYFRKGEVARAKESLNEALEIRNKMHYWPGLTTTQIELARIHLSEKSYDVAEKLLCESLELSMQMNARQKAILCHTLLSELHKIKGNFQLALEHLENSYRLKTEIAGEEASNRIKQLQNMHATEQADQEAEIHRLKHVELKQAYDAIEDQNKSILDSINYAQRIQSALLGSRSMLSNNIPQSFVLYKPKDIVSGDFWWCVEQNDEFWFAVADCTGHGVPGAFMSLLNINLLNRALAEHKNASPAFLLDEVRTQVIASLNREGQEEARDGMDVVLCALNKNGRLRFACANNTLVHVRNGVLTPHGPDKFPVGLSPTEVPLPFTEFELMLSKGDCVYLSTDGFADQFGGTKGKKFKQKRLRELFVQNTLLPLAEQESILEKEFESWRGNLEQVDDVLVMGFRFN